jgi:hypothetical protein
MFLRESQSSSDQFYGSYERKSECAQNEARYRNIEVFFLDLHYGKCRTFCEPACFSITMNGLGLWARPHLLKQVVWLLC